METLDGDVRKVGIIRERLDLEDKGWGEGRMDIRYVAQKELVGLHRMVGEQQTADGVSQEAFGAFADGGTGVAAFGRTVANKEAGDVVFDQVLIEIGEETPDALVGPAVGVGEEIDERVEDDKTSVDAFNRFKEAGKILRKGEGTIAGWVRGVFGVLDVREDFNAREIGSHSSEQWELGSSCIGCRCDDDNTALNGWSAIGHGSARGDRGSDLEGEEAFTTAVVAVQEGDASKGETFFPEPTDGLKSGLGEIVFVNGKGDG